MVYVENGFIETTWNSTVLIKNIAVYCMFKNIHQYNREVVLTSSADEGNVIEFGTGYWTFSMISERLREEGITLTENRHNNTRRIHCKTDEVELGNFGILLGFEKDTTKSKDLWKDSPNEININMGLKYITIGCDCVNTLKNFNTKGERTKNIATLPITTQQRLNNTVTYYKDVNFEAPITNGKHNFFNFHVDTNVIIDNDEAANDANHDVEMKVLIECYIK